MSAIQIRTMDESVGWKIRNLLLILRFLSQDAHSLQPHVEVICFGSELEMGCTSEE